MPVQIVYRVAGAAPTRHIPARTMSPFVPAIWLLPVLLMCFCLMPVRAVAEPVAEGAAFPALVLAGEPDATQKDYLGLSGNGPWALRDVQAEFICIEVFSMYCPHCQAEAPSVNELFDWLHASEAGKSMKMLGIGAGNSPFEVDFFQKKYGVAMPLFADETLVQHRAMGRPGTPHFFLLQRDGAGFRTLYSKTGRMKSPGELGATLLEKAGLKE